MVVEIPVDAEETLEENQKEKLEEKSEEKLEEPVTPAPTKRGRPKKVV